MRLLTLVLSLSIASIAGPAAAQVSIDPPTPKPFHTIRVKVPASALGLDGDGQPDHYESTESTVVMLNNKITISLLMRGHTDFGSPTPALDQEVGALPPGIYELEVVKRATGKGSPGKVGSTITFTVPARTPSEPIANYTDLWWLASESGWGFGLFHHPTHQMFGTLFVYGAEGRPTWYVIPAGQFVDAARFEGQLYRTTGPYFGGPFNSAQVQAIPAGNAVIIFDQYDLDKASLTFVIDGVTFNKSVQRQSF
jgi:hypothetical protein